MTGIVAGRWRFLTWAALSVLIALALHCGGAPSPEDGGSALWPLVEATEHDVTVALHAQIDAAGGAWISATFTPARRGFHLYAKDLPREGLNGIGRPTLLELDRAPVLVARGPIEADRATVPLHVPVLQMTFPVYPEGPVTLRLPVTVTAALERRATVSVTYLACSDTTCLAPVIRKPFIVTLPDRYVARARASV